jgi:hypothetical protein
MKLDVDASGVRVDLIVLMDESAMICLGAPEKAPVGGARVVI